MSKGFKSPTERLYLNVTHVESPSNFVASVGRRKCICSFGFLNEKCVCLFAVVDCQVYDLSSFVEMRKKLKEWCEKYSFEEKDKTLHEKLFRNKQVLVKYENGSFLPEFNWYRAKMIYLDSNE